MEESKKDLQEPLLQPKIQDNGGQEVEIESVSFWKFFQFATGYDKFLMFVGTVSSTLNGFAIPMFILLFGDMTSDIATNMDDLMPVARKYAERFLEVGGIAFVLSYITMSTWMVTGERQATKFRIAYFKTLLRQDISWYDKTNLSELSTKVANDTFAIQGALGEKIGTFIYTIALTIGSFVVAFLEGWQLAAALAAVNILAVLIIGALYIWGVQGASVKNNKAYEYAGGYAEQALACVRTVRSLNGEEKEIKQYSSALENVKKVAIKFGVVAGYSLGFMFFILIGSYGFGFWYGAKLIEDGVEGYTSGKIVTIFFSTTLGTFMLAQMTPVIKSFALGKKALARFVNIYERVPTIDIENPSGKVLNSVYGEVKFNNVQFSYPSRPNQEVLHGLNIT